ncbi:hypothetical protein [Paenibacillus luteus]|uniref:hypothetical protein n=1 Tax=Paenibacillus luteus TaxID=2545753 RepID=UPI0019D6071C|nr:hypothetical protein [Paenibacillus luteus]
MIETVNIFCKNKEIVMLEESVSVDKVISAIHQLIVEKDYILTSMNIDGIHISDNYDETILKNLGKINSIILDVRTKKELETEMIVEMIQYLERALPAMDILINNLYKSGIEIRWDLFTDFIEGASWLITAIEFITSTVQLSEGNSLLDVLKELNTAVENHDSILMADILMYEIKPYYSIILKQLENINN